jgi:hypothetical protein
MSERHYHSRDTAHTPGSNRRRLTVVLLLTVAYMVAEVIGGFLANSLCCPMPVYVDGRQGACHRSLHFGLHPSVKGWRTEWRFWRRSQTGSP